MLFNSFNTFSKKDGLQTCYKSILPISNIIQYLIFYLLLCVIDLIVLIYYTDYLKFTIPKLGIDLVMASLILFFPSKVSHLHINLFLSITKVSSQIFIVIIGNDVILIFVFICEVNDISPQYQWEYIGQRIFTKVSGLIIISVNFSILNIISLLFVLLIEMYRILLFFKERKVFQSEKLFQSIQVPKEDQLHYLKENAWISRVQLMPLCLFLFSAKDLKINFTNQFSQKYFKRNCRTQEELEELILDKMLFQTVHLPEQKSYTTQLHFFQSRLRQKQTQKDSDSLILPETTNSLREILKECSLGKHVEMEGTLELLCQHSWDADTLSDFTGSVKINNEDGEIMLVLIDISNQQRLQEENIKNQFKSQIVQSFSHQLRTPLNSACNFLQCCLGDRKIEDSTKLTFLQPAYNALRLQSHLINDIIDFNSFYADDIELFDREFLIKDLIDEVNFLFKSSLEMKELALYIDLFENEQPKICTDFSRLTQIIVNIIQNSIKYSKSGLILVKMTSYSSSYLKFTIKDEGIGISEERLFQIHQMLTDVEKKRDFMKHKLWHGFGLLISQMLLTKLCPHDYKSLIIRSSGVNKGTKVTFYIQNRNNTVSNGSSNNCVNTLRQIVKAKPSMQAVVHQASINGTIIQICDVGAPYRKFHTLIINKTTLKSFDNSMFTDSFLNLDDLNQKMYDLNYVKPPFTNDFLLQGVTIKYDPQEQQIIGDSHIRSGKEPTAKVLSYKIIKLQDEIDNEILLKAFIKRKKCHCQRILSIDDEIFNQKSIQLLLSRQGFEVVLAFNGEEAIRIVKDIERCCPTCSLFLLILTDYQMPIMDGIETTKNLCLMMKEHIIPYMHIIGLTAFNSKKDIKNCIDAGMSDVLAKPLNMKEFYEILSTL